MKRAEFREFSQSRPIILDGATGTELQKRGLPNGVCPELWAIENPQVLTEIAAAYREAGSDIVYSCTFGGNRAKLTEFDLADRLDEINMSAAKIAKVAVGDGLIAGDIAPTGKIIEPSGDFSFVSAMAIFREQAAALLRAGVDLFVIETMLDIQEARAALIAVREIAPDLPIIVSMTFGEDGRTLTGGDPLTALITLQSLGADAFGCNCSVGPEKMIEWLRAIKPYSTVPLLAKPNAGTPRLVAGKTVFAMSESEFALYAPALISAGANLIGGCCGTSPAFVSAAAKAVKNLPTLPPPRRAINAISSMRQTVFIGDGAPFAVIGERINPTGKKALQAELRENKFALAQQFAREQTANGATILDVNVGAAGVDETALLPQAVRLLSPITPCPLCIDTANPQAMEAALQIYPGRALLNSISAETERFAQMLPLAKKYGAMLIVLPVSDSGVPETLAARQNLTRDLLANLEREGFARENLLIDGLVLSVSSSPVAPKITADFVEWCAQELHLATVGGLSNVSFGMPAREHLNLAFLGDLLGKGFSAALINPSLSVMMNLVKAHDALFERDKNFTKYLAEFGNANATAATASAKINSTDGQKKSAQEMARDCVLNGDADALPEILATALRNGESAADLMNVALLPAINQVGDWFEKKIYFLPQLMLSAAALSKGCAFLEPHLATNAVIDERKKIVLATVKGDNHDIGKNIVALLLRNHGFTVIDLGKDVSAKTIVDAANNEHATLVGLSALMTTTMTEMEKTIAYARINGGEHLQFLVGGAAVDRHFAEGIGAHYAADAVAAVKVAKRLLDEISGNYSAVF